MSYGQKSNAWSRQGPQITPGPNVFTSQALSLAAAAGQPFSGLSGVAGMPSINALVNQAAFSNMNVLAQAQRTQIMPQQQVAPQQSRSVVPTDKSQRAFVGTVTKMAETYGFVDDDVFFQTTVIRGGMPRVGDKVMVEASFNPSMPFKWNALRIQLIQQEIQQKQPQHQQFRSNQHQQSYNGSNNIGGRWERQGREEQRNYGQDKGRINRRSPLRQEKDTQAQGRRFSPARRSRSPIRHISPKRASPLRRQEVAIKRSALDRDRSPPSIREPSDIPRTRSPTSSKRDADSPPRRRQRIIPRYHCNLPKTIPSSYKMKYVDLHKRYTNLYIPSDLVYCEMSWLNSLRMEDPLKFSPHPITFHVLHKDIDVLLNENESPLIENPPDADNRYIVKVIFLSHPGSSVLRNKTYGLLADGTIDESIETQSIAKSLQLLIGYRSKEFMGIGGAWSPSLDGSIPTDPQTLINTAVRATRSLTGIDLSNCPRWYKLLHFHYFRAERNRVDNVILMLPDTSSTPGLMPSSDIYSLTRERIMKQLADKLAAIDAEEFVIDSIDGAGSDKKNNATFEGGTNIHSSENLNVGLAQSDIEATNEIQPPHHSEDLLSQDANEAELMDSAPINLGPKSKTHWSNINIKALKVAELREELEFRGLDSKGVKNVLAQRLQEAVDKEKLTDKLETPDNSIALENQEQTVVVKIKEEVVELMETDEAVGDNNNDELVEKPDEPTAEEIEKQQKEIEKAREKFDKDKKDRKAALERHYKIPDKPCVLVYPSKTAKAGKFDCKNYSLSSLLDYRLEDNKESSFEVFLFSESLKECIDRLYAFSIYHTIAFAASKEDESKFRDLALQEALKLEKEKQKADIDDDIQVINGDKEEGKDRVQKDEKQKEDPRKNFTAVVHDIDTFVAFAHFDSNICGYINEKDLEDIIYSIGVNISRSDAQKTVKKLSSRDRINYRNLTDKWINKDGESVYIPSSRNDFQSKLELLKRHQYEPEGISTDVLSNLAGATPDVSDSGIVLYKGSVFNIQQNIEQYALVEKERTESLLKNTHVECQLKATKEQRDQLDKKKRRLEEDLDRYKKKLHSTEKSLRGKEDECKEIKNALSDCKRYSEKTIAVVDKIIPPPPPKKDEKEVILLVETDDAGAKKNEKSKKQERSSSCPKLSE